MRQLAAVLALLLAAAPLAAQSPPAWTRGATCYEVFVRSFQDSDGDGIGDINGLISRLDYINDGNDAAQHDLGARCIWLMPVSQSPSYHGYDVTDYYTVERDYGTNADFKRLVAEAHRRGIRVLVDLVLNHASSEHPYFQQALRDTASPYRAWFRWSPVKRDEKTSWDAEVWHKSPARDEWYFALFWGGMPDLNYAHAPVMEEAKRIARFWIDSMGVDGFRLDAIKHLVEEPGKVQHAAGTHVALRDWSAYVRGVKPDVYTVGEVWDSIGAMLPYYPDQLTSHFAFEVADGILGAVRSGSARRLLEPSLRLQREVPAHRWSPFLRNHDQTRTRTELGGDMAKARLASALLLTMPGMPFVYYGEEIGMVGDKPDERLRTPMPWTRGPSAGFTTGKPWERLQADSVAANVATQQGDTRSILALHRQLVHLRAANPALGGGELVPLVTSDSTVTAYVRRDSASGRAMLVLANLGTKPAFQVSITSAERVLPAGRYTARTRLGTPAPASVPITMDADGRVARWLPMRALAPLELYLFELVPTPAARVPARGR
jgi:glycosidase